jgi:hypothetical protein
MTGPKCVAKIKQDFAAALPYWKKYFNEWLFTHNDVNGLGPHVVELLLRLTAKHKPVVARHYGYMELLLEFRSLGVPDVATLLGPAPGLQDMVSVSLGDIGRLLQHIALRPESADIDLRPVPGTKLVYNQLSEASGTLLRAGMTRAETVRKYFRGLADQSRYDRVASAFRMRYQQLRTEGYAPDDILSGLQKFISGDVVATPSHQAATLAILAFFFEACEIFERPPTELFS